MRTSIQVSGLPRRIVPPLSSTSEPTACARVSKAAAIEATEPPPPSPLPRASGGCEGAACSDSAVADAVVLLGGGDRLDNVGSTV